MIKWSKRTNQLDKMVLTYLVKKIFNLDLRTVK